MMLLSLGIWCLPFPLVDSEEAARQSIYCRRQQAAGGNASLTIFISSSSLSPEYLLLSLWHNGDAPRIHQALAWARAEWTHRRQPWPLVDHMLLTFPCSITGVTIFWHHCCTRYQEQGAQKGKQKSLWTVICVEMLWDLPSLRYSTPNWTWC